MTPAQGSVAGRAEAEQIRLDPLQDLGCLFTLLNVGTVLLELGMCPLQLGTATLDFRPFRLFSC